MDIKAVRKILAQFETAVIRACPAIVDKEPFARQICQLAEPKHLGRAKFKTAYADELGDEPKPEEIVCPFCESEGGFDKVGLKYHLSKYCKVFEETIDVYRAKA